MEQAQSNGTGNLAGAICAVMADVGEVPKTGYNAFHRFNYSSDVDILKAFQPAMARHGLALVQTGIEQTTVAHADSKQGRPQYRTEIVVRYRLLHTSGESVEVASCGFGVDGDDKGAYKALTGALKYAIRAVFLPACEVGADPDRAANGNGQTSSASPRPAAAPANSARRPAPGDEPEPNIRHGNRWDEPITQVGQDGKGRGQLGLVWARVLDAAAGDKELAQSCIRDQYERFSIGDLVELKQGQTDNLIWHACKAVRSAQPPAGEAA